MADRAPYVCCIGAANLDRTYKLQRPGVLGTSNPATVELHRGGVARNVAENLARLNVASKLLSVVGDDEAGRALLEQTQRQGVDIAPVAVLSGRSSGSYVAIIEPWGELFTGISDLEICAALDPASIDRHWELIGHAQAVFADANPPAATLEHLRVRCAAVNIPLFLDAVSVSKAVRLPANLRGVEVLFCNLDEAEAIAGDDAGGTDPLTLARRLRARGAACAVVSLGAAGVQCATPEGCQLLPAEASAVTDVSGAGDALLAATLAGRVNGLNLTDSLRMGMRVASLTIRVAGPIWTGLSMSALKTDFSTR